MPDLPATIAPAATRVTLEDLVAGCADRPQRVPAPATIAAELRRTRTKLLVVDDDPTGSQTVADVPLLTRWEEDDLRWALTRPSDVAFVLTNSRALDEAAAVAVNRDVGVRAQAIAARLGIRLAVVSRSDSILRGHFPAETLALDAGLRQAGAPELDGIVVCPAFPEAGRFTVGGTHWVRQDDGTLLPAAETEFARDPVFAYENSDLVDWVVARGAGRWAVDDIARIALDDVRRGGPEAVAGILRGVRGARPVVVDVADESDLLVLAAGLTTVEGEGRRFVARTGPSFVAARAGRAVPPPIDGPIAPQGAAGVLVVVGSHTALTTRQLDAAAAGHRLRVLELDTASIVSSDNAAAREVRQLAARAAAALADGDVAIATSRTLVAAGTPAESVALKARIARAVVDASRAVVRRRRPAALIAKGGITAHQLASDALETSRATVLGQLFPGQVSAWRLEDSAVAPGLSYVVFPGNVGGASALVDAITRIKEAG